MRGRRSLLRFHGHCPASRIDGSAVFYQGFLLSLQGGDRHRNVHSCRADRRAVQGGMGLARTVLREDAESGAGHRQIPVAADLRKVHTLVQGQADVQVHSRSAGAAGNADYRRPGRAVRLHSHAGSNAVSAKEHNGLVCRADIGNVHAGADRHCAAGHRGGEYIRHPGQGSRHVNGTGKRHRHLPDSRDIFRKVQAHVHRAVHGNTAGGHGDTGHIHVAGRNGGKGQAARLDGAAALGFVVGFGANVGSRFQLVDRDRRGHADSRCASRHCNRDSLRTAGKVVSHIQSGISRVNSDILADAAASFTAVQRQQDARVHRDSARRQRRRNHGGIGRSGSGNIDLMADVLDGLGAGAADCRVGLAVKVSHGEGSVHAHCTCSRRNVRGQHPAEVHPGLYIQVGGLFHVAGHLRLYIGEYIQGGAADADAGRAARRCDREQADVSVTVTCFFFRFADVCVNVADLQLVFAVAGLRGLEARSGGGPASAGSGADKNISAGGKGRVFIYPGLHIGVQHAYGETYAHARATASRGSTGHHEGLQFVVGGYIDVAACCGNGAAAADDG